MREKEIFYKSKLSLTPMRKVASYVGRLCEEGRVEEDFAPLELRGILFGKGVEQDFAPMELRDFFLEKELSRITLR